MLGWLVSRMVQIQNKAISNPTIRMKSIYSILIVILLAVSCDLKDKQLPYPLNKAGMCELLHYDNNSRLASLDNTKKYKFVKEGEGLSTFYVFNSIDGSHSIEIPQEYYIGKEMYLILIRVNRNNFSLYEKIVMQSPGFKIFMNQDEKENRKAIKLSEDCYLIPEINLVENDSYDLMLCNLNKAEFTLNQKLN